MYSTEKYRKSFDTDNLFALTPFEQKFANESPFGIIILVKKVNSLYPLIACEKIFVDHKKLIMESY